MGFGEESEGQTASYSAWLDGLLRVSEQRKVCTYYRLNRQADGWKRSIDACYSEIISLVRVTEESKQKVADFKKRWNDLQTKTKHDTSCYNMRGGYRKLKAECKHTAYVFGFLDSYDLFIAELCQKHRLFMPDPGDPHTAFTKGGL